MPSSIGMVIGRRDVMKFINDMGTDLVIHDYKHEFSCLWSYRLFNHWYQF